MTQSMAEFYRKGVSAETQQSKHFDPLVELKLKVIMYVAAIAATLAIVFWFQLSDKAKFKELLTKGIRARAEVIGISQRTVERRSGRRIKTSHFETVTEIRVEYVGLDGKSHTAYYTGPTGAESQVRRGDRVVVVFNWNEIVTAPKGFEWVYDERYVKERAV